MDRSLQAETKVDLPGNFTGIGAKVRPKSLREIVGMIFPSHLCLLASFICMVI